jgi:hypothetical protein
MIAQLLINLILLQYNTLDVNMKWIISVLILLSLVTIYLNLKPKFLKLN